MYIYIYIYIYILIAYPPAPCGPSGCEAYVCKFTTTSPSISSILQVCKFTALQSVSILQFTNLRPFNHFKLVSYSMIAL